MVFFKAELPCIESRRVPRQNKGDFSFHKTEGKDVVIIICLFLQQVTKVPQLFALFSTVRRCVSFVLILRLDSHKLQRGMQIMLKLQGK